jgi:hypothetical protein
MKRMIEETLLQEGRLDDYTVSEVITLLSIFPKEAKLNFLQRWDYDISFEIVLEREQTDEEALKAEKDLQELIDYQAAQERKEYERLKAKYGEWA